MVSLFLSPILQFYPDFSNQFSFELSGIHWDLRRLTELTKILGCVAWVKERMILGHIPILLFWKWVKCPSARRLWKCWLAEIMLDWLCYTDGIRSTQLTWWNTGVTLPDMGGTIHTQSPGHPPRSLFCAVKIKNVDSSWVITVQSYCTVTILQATVMITLTFYWQ